MQAVVLLVCRALLHERVCQASLQRLPLLAPLQLELASHLHQAHGEGARAAPIIAFLVLPRHVGARQVACGSGKLPGHRFLNRALLNVQAAWPAARWV